MSRTISTRVSREVEDELRLYMDMEKVDRATAVRDFIELGAQQWRKEVAIRLLTDGKVTAWRAAEIAKLPLWDFTALLDERKVVLPIKSDDIIGDIRSALKGKP